MTGVLMNRLASSTLSLSAAALLMSACAPASLGSPPASERNRDCAAGETLVCRDRQPSRLGDKENQFCTCEPFNSGVRY